MTDFDYDILEKKRTASGARHRKRGSKSKKCTLPSDHLTHSQWKKKNGDVIVFTMDTPIVWADFLQLSPVTQKEYLSHLVEKFRASGATISQMMNVSYTRFMKHCKEIGFSLTGCRGHNMSKDQRQAWNAFLIGGESDTASAEVGPSAEEEEQTPPENAVLVQPLRRQPEQPPVMTSFSFRFDGAIDPDGIANTIRSVLGGKSARGAVDIHCSLWTGEWDEAPM